MSGLPDYFKEAISICYDRAEVDQNYHRIFPLQWPKAFQACQDVFDKWNAIVDVENAENVKKQKETEQYENEIIEKARRYQP